jgi:hypothetical protein
MIRLDFESAVTSRYDRRETDAAIAAWVHVTVSHMQQRADRWVAMYDAPCRGRPHVPQTQ